jgi:four helix bundle protein
MTPAELSERTMLFALRVMKMADCLPRTTAARNVASQVTRSACAVAANYRATQRAKSPADFAHKVAIVLEEADEAEFWIELIVRAKFLAEPRLVTLHREAGELVRIFAAMRRTTRNRPWLANLHTSNIAHHTFLRLDLHQAVLNRASRTLIRRSRTKPTRPMVMIERMMCS